jgi:hypothetical protein
MYFVELQQKYFSQYLQNVYLNNNNNGIYLKIRFVRLLS